MRTLLQNLMRGEKYTTERYVYYDLTIDIQVQKAVKDAIANKGMGIPCDITIRQEMLRLDEAEGTIHAKHRLGIQVLKEDLVHLRNKISDIKARIPEYVESEKAIIEDRVYEGIDVLKAKTDKLESQIEEHKKYNSDLNQKDDE